MTGPVVSSPADAWRVGRDLVVQATALRVKRDSHTGRRDAPEPLPASYDELLREAQVYALLAGGPPAVPVEVDLFASPVPGRPQPIPPQLRLDPAAGPGPQRARRQNMPAGQIVEHRPTTEENQQ